VILYIIINAATKASLRAKYEWAQMALLAKIAMQQGVPAKEIEKTFGDAGL
jgi:chromosome segregation and condensation protein ScpB